MAIQIKDMDKYGSFTHEMLVDEIYVLKTRLALCKLDNKTMHARYMSQVKAAQDKAAAVAVAKPEVKVVCPKCLSTVTMKSMVVRDVSNNRTVRFASCPVCGTMHSQKDVQEATTKHALQQAAQTSQSVPVDVDAVSNKLICRFGLKNE